MNLKIYLAQQRGLHAGLAKAIGAHAPDVYRWAKGTRPVPTKYGAAIELHTQGAVTRREMFPDEWAAIWPELTKENT